MEQLDSLPAPSTGDFIERTVHQVASLVRAGEIGQLRQVLISLLLSARPPMEVEYPSSGMPGSRWSSDLLRK